MYWPGTARGSSVGLSFTLKPIGDTCRDRFSNRAAAALNKDPLSAQMMRRSPPVSGSHRSAEGFAELVAIEAGNDLAASNSQGPLNQVGLLCHQLQGLFGT